jgi:hypothetical protein
LTATWCETAAPELSQVAVGRRGVKLADDPWRKPP